MKLKRKINDNVQILTHIKEKLQFVGSENEKENDRLRSYDEEVKEVSSRIPLLPSAECRVTLNRRFPFRNETF